MRKPWLFGPTRRLAGVVLGTLVVGLLAGRLAAYYADVRSAEDVKRELSGQVMTLATTETEGLTIIIENLSPHAYIRSRCSSPTGLPGSLSEPERHSVCAEAIGAELVEEQQRNLDVRAAHLQGVVLSRHLLRRVGPDISSEYTALLSSLESVRKLNSATTCNQEQRLELARQLGSMYPWMGSDKVAGLADATQSASPCDHGSQKYVVAASFVAEGLAFESTVIAAHIEDSHVSGLTDTRGKLLEELLTDWTLWVLILIGSGIYLALAVIDRDGTPD